GRARDGCAVRRLVRRRLAAEGRVRALVRGRRGRADGAREDVGHRRAARRRGARGVTRRDGGGGAAAGGARARRCGRSGRTVDGGGLVRPGGVRQGRLRGLGRQHRRLTAGKDPLRRDAFVNGYARTDGGTIDERLRMQVVDVDGQLEGETGDRQEILYVLSGSGSLGLAGETHRLDPDAGVLLLPGERYVLTGDLRLI